MPGDTDTGNAHVRKVNRRAESDVKASDARRLLDDPAFKAGVARVRDGLIDALENFKHDGTPETDAVEREYCRALRTLNCVTRSLSTTVQGQALRLANFKPLPPQDDDEKDTG